MIGSFQTVSEMRGSVCDVRKCVSRELTNELNQANSLCPLILWPKETLIQLYSL